MMHRLPRGAPQPGTQRPPLHEKVGKPVPVGQSLVVVQVGTQILLPDGSVAQVQPVEVGGHFIDVQSALVVHEGGPPELPLSLVPVPPPSRGPVPLSPPPSRGPVPLSPLGPVPLSPGPVGCDLLQDAGIVAVKRRSPRSRPMRHGGAAPSAGAAW